MYHSEGLGLEQGGLGSEWGVGYLESLCLDEGRGFMFKCFYK